MDPMPPLGVPRLGRAAAPFVPQAEQWGVRVQGWQNSSPTSHGSPGPVLGPMRPRAPRPQGPQLSRLRAAAAGPARRPVGVSGGLGCAPASPVTLRTFLCPQHGCCPSFSSRSGPGDDPGSSHSPRVGGGRPCRGPGAGAGHPRTAAWRGPRQASRVFLRPAGPDRAEVRQPEAERRKRCPHQGHQQVVQVGQARAAGDGLCLHPPAEPGPASGCQPPPAAVPSAAPQPPPTPAQTVPIKAPQRPSAGWASGGGSGLPGPPRTRPPAARPLAPAARPGRPGADSPLSPRGDAGGGSSSGCGSACPELGRPGSSPSLCCYSPSLVPLLRVPRA